jgi:hypothetical protein
MGPKPLLSRSLGGNNKRTMFRSLDDLRVLLGLPLYRSAIGEDVDGARVAAHWPCGCTASGATFARLALRTCRTHRAGRVEPAIAV